MVSFFVSSLLLFIVSPKAESKQVSTSSARLEVIGRLVRKVHSDQSLPANVRGLVILLHEEILELVNAHEQLANGASFAHQNAEKGFMEEESTAFGNFMLTLIVLGVLVAGLLAVLRLWIKGARFAEEVDGSGRVAVVTGANSGIGKQLCCELAMRHVRVYMFCRKFGRGWKAKSDLVSRYGCNPTDLVVMEGDLCSFHSIRKFVTDFRKVEDRLDILVNNAGVMCYPQFEMTKDNFELTFQSNYLGHFLLTELLRPLLEASAVGGRVVNVSGIAQVFADTVDFDVCNDPRRFGRWVKTYARSKLAQIMHAVALTKRIRVENPASRVSINACHPGAVSTNLPRYIPGYQRLLKTIFKPLIWFVLKTENDGAQTPLFLALSETLDGVSGKYFSDCAENPARVNALARSPSECEQLYNASLKACGLCE